MVTTVRLAIPLKKVTVHYEDIVITVDNCVMTDITYIPKRYMKPAEQNG